MKPAPFSLARPASLREAIQLLGGEDDAAAIAGGQSLLVMMGLRVASYARLVALARLPELRDAREDDGFVFLGAATTHAAIEDGRVPDPSRGLMRRVAGGIAYRAVRNRGTIGGSLALADPGADWIACLIALEARLLIAGPSSERRLAVRDFVQGPYVTALEQGGIIVGVEIPRLGGASRWGFAKHARKAGAFADSIAVVVRRPDADPVVVLGATLSHAQPLERTGMLLGERWDAPEPDIARALCADIAAVDPDADGYHRRCHQAMALSAIREART